MVTGNRCGKFCLLETPRQTIQHEKETPFMLHANTNRRSRNRVEKLACAVVNHLFSLDANNKSLASNLGGKFVWYFVRHPVIGRFTWFECRTFDVCLNRNLYCRTDARPLKLGYRAIKQIVTLSFHVFHSTSSSVRLWKTRLETEWFLFFSSENKLEDVLKSSWLF